VPMRLRTALLTTLPLLLAGFAPLFPAGAPANGRGQLRPFVIELQPSPAGPPAVRRVAARERARAVLSWLEGQKRSGGAGRARLLWVNDTVLVDLDPRLAPEAARLPGVRAVRPDRPLAPDSVDGDQSGPNPNAPVSEALIRMNVDQVWAQGYTGKGVVLALIDTGVDWTHPDLADHIWVNPGEIDGDGTDNDGNGYVDDVRGWDFLENDPDPQDDTGHGTRMAGLAVGDGTSGQQTGAAPDAELMILKRGSTEGSIWEAIQYAIDSGADLIVQGFSFSWTDQPNYPQWRRTAETTLTAGLLHVASAGNNGNRQALDPIPYNVDAPANCPPPYLHAEQANPGGLSAV